MEKKGASLYRPRAFNHVRDGTFSTLETVKRDKDMPNFCPCQCVHYHFLPNSLLLYFLFPIVYS